jgi:hypothetical protein
MDTIRSKLTDFSPPGITGRLRVILWVLLLAVTSALILYPANMKYEYSVYAIPFVYIFDNLSLFAVLYYIWLLLLLVLLLTRGSEKWVDWEKAALVVIFAIVFTGYSTFVSGGKLGDALTPAGDIKNFMRQEHFTLATALKYHGYPGFSLLGAGVCLITGLDITHYMTIFPFFQIILFSTVLYLFFNRLLKNPYFAALGVLVAIQVDMSVATSLPVFHAGAFAPFCLLILALLLFTAGRESDNRRIFRLETHEVLILAVLAALFISHLITSVVAFFTALGIYIIQKVSGKRVVSTQLVVLLISVLAIWNLAENLSQLKYLATWIPKAISALLSGQMIHNWLLPLQTTSLIGARAPLWTLLPLYLGPLTIVIIGGILGLARLFRIRRLEKGEIIALGGLSGLVVLALILLFLRGLEESYGRSLIYLALFTVPIMMWWIYRLKNTRKYVLSLVVVVLFVLSLPAFLLNNKSVARATYYPREVASGEFLESSYGNGSGIHVYGMEGSVYYLTYYLPHAYLFLANPLNFRSTDVQDIWQDVNEYVSNMEKETARYPIRPVYYLAYYLPYAYLDLDNPPISRRTSARGIWQKVNEYISSIERESGKSNRPKDVIIMFSPKWDAPFRDYIGTDVKNSPEWQEIQSRLTVNNLIYDNGFVQVYERPH